MKVLTVLNIISILLLTWLLTSYIEIICKNLNDPIYSSLNLIIKFLEV